MDLLCFGEALYDIYPDRERIGGAPLNVAICAKLLGVDSNIITAVGNDLRGDNLISYLRKHKLHQYAQVNSHPTGTVTIKNSNDAQFIISDNSAYDYIAPFSQTTAKMFYLGTLAQRHRASRQSCHSLLEKQTYVFFDPNLRPNTPWQKSFEQTMPHTTILKLNSQELHVIANYLDTKDIIITLFSTYPVEQIIITKAQLGAQLYLRDGTCKEVGTTTVTAIDTVGAGDAFSAGYIYSYLASKSPQECLDFATKLGSAMTTIYGAQPKKINVRGGFITVE